MLCSNCSQVIRPVVALDIDGTLGDYHSHLLQFMRAYTGYGYLPGLRRPYSGKERFSEYCMEQFDIDLRTFRDIKLAYRQGAQKRSMPVKVGASNLTKQLVMDDAEIWITTTRPYLRLDGIDPDTRFWLDHNEIDYYGLLYDEYKYRQLARCVDPARVAAVLDDLPDQLDEALMLFPNADIYMLRNEYNYEILREPVIPDLRAAVDKMVMSVRRWKGAHGREQQLLRPDTERDSGGNLISHRQSRETLRGSVSSSGAEGPVR